MPDAEQIRLNYCFNTASYQLFNQMTNIMLVADVKGL